jgi:hypothetical protein
MTFPTGREPNYRALGIGLATAIIGALLLAIVVDLTAGILFFAVAIVLGGLAAVLTGDLPASGEYDIPEMYVGEQGWKQWVKWPLRPKWPGRRNRP